MAATAKFVRGQWGVYFNQHNTRWYLAQEDRMTALLVEKEANRQMKAGVDLRPADKRPAARAATPQADTSATTTTSPTPEATSQMTKDTLFETFANQCIRDEAAANKETTNRGYDKDLRIHLFPALKGKRLCELTRPLVKRTLTGIIEKVSDRTGRRLRNKSIESIHATLCVILEAAYEQGLIPANPAYRIKEKYLRNPDQVDEELRVWTPTECDRFLKYVKVHARFWYGFFFFSLRCGTRVGETAELRWDKDLKTPGKVHIQRAWAFRPRRELRVLEDGSNEFVWKSSTEKDRITPTKGKSKRKVDYFPEVEQAMKEHRAMQREWAFARRKPAPSLMFTSEKGMHISDVTVLKLINKLCPLAKVPPITIHGLRHTYASILIARGEIMEYVSKQLGHAQLSTTDNNYRHFMPDDDVIVERRRNRQAEIWRVAAGESE